jgi:hypothetical protein
MREENDDFKLIGAGNAIDLLTQVQRDGGDGDEQGNPSGNAQGGHETARRSAQYVAQEDHDGGPGAS